MRTKHKVREERDVIDTGQRGHVAKETRCTHARAKKNQRQRLGADPDDNPAYTCCTRKADTKREPIRDAETLYVPKKETTTIDGVKKKPES